jgi:hypothetical protein
MEESVVREVSTISFRNMDNCTCLASQLGACLHNIPDGIKDQLLRTAERTFGGGVSVLRSGVTDDVSERLAIFADLLHPPQQTYVQRRNFMLVQKSQSGDHIPEHTCHKASATKMGAQTSIRYRLPFRAGSEIITLDARILPVKWTHIYLLDDLAAKVEEKMRSFGIQANIIQIMAQDPIFHKIQGAFRFAHQEYDVHVSSSIYGTYLYMKFCLMTYLDKLDDGTILEAMNPVPVLIELPENGNKDVKMINDVICSRNSGEYREDLEKISNLGFDKMLMEQGPREEVVDKLFDAFKNESFCHRAIEAYSYLSKYRQIVDFPRRVISYYIDQKLAEPHTQFSSRMHLYAPEIPDSKWRACVNFLNIVPNPNFLTIGPEIIWLGIHERTPGPDRIPFSDKLPHFQVSGRRLFKP